MPAGISVAQAFDYIVVGAGTAGSILAARLAEDTGTTVCVVEAGPADRHPLIHVPAGFTRLLSEPSVTWQFRTEPSEGTAGRQIATVQGRVLGGSGAINGMIYVRGQPADYDHWAQLGNRGWGYEDLLPYFRRVERRIGGGSDGGTDEAVRGRSGPIPVTDMDWIHPVSEAFIDAAVKAGMPRNPDYNSGDQEGVGYFQRTIDRGLRSTTAKAYLKPAMRRGAIRLVTRATATAVTFEGTRATGVRVLRDGVQAEETIKAKREVILCAGTVNTARLLQISGIGPAGLLRDIGADVVADRPGVGANLIDHYSARLVMRARPHVVTLNELARGPRLAGQILRWAAKRPSILALTPSQIYLFRKSSPELDLPDLQCVFTPGSYKEGQHYVLDSYPGVTGGAWQHRPLSRGHVHARSLDVRVDPVIQPNYLAHPIDRQVMVAGMNFVRSLLHSPGLAAYLEAETIPGDKVHTDDEMLDFCRRNGSTGYHLVGTARMGSPDDAMAVVDDRLKVHGVGALRVADASVMPGIPSANTHTATMVVAEKASDMIRER
ncbi:GMC family oxidoreductase [Microbaculum marinum]|uniref:GMC family oxidoreductase N-terminal domain-containing protein n=1 Tax=Microbaculum marinum TaxID=1764581 RepID=A0AAW9RMF7_9HYPH